MRIRLSAALAVTAASVLVTSMSAGVAAARDHGGQGHGGQGHGGRVVIASTAPESTAGPPRPLAAGRRVRLSVFVGRDQAGLAAAATAISDPASPRYQHYLSPAQVQARFGATAAQQRAVRGWLRRSGLAVTHDDGFVITAAGTAARAEAALRAGLALSHPAGSVAQVVPSRAMSVPAAAAGAIATIRVSTAAVPLGPHQPLRAAASVVPGSRAAARYPERCSAYYGQKTATRLPGAYGRRITWAPCGYQPAQLRAAYGATRAGLTGAGTSVAILSETGYPTALRDANRWARQRHFPPFARGQFSARVARNPGGGATIEDAMDIEAVHGMAPAARIVYVVGNGHITGDVLLDSLDTVVRRRLAKVVTASWYEGFMPVPESMIRSWEGVLQRAAVEGITVNIASGDFGNRLGLEYPSSDPWDTSVGGTSLAIGARGKYLWETGWDSAETGLARNGRSWHPAPPGQFAGASTGGVSRKFAQPRYQHGVVHGNVWHGRRMRAVPDVSALGDPDLGYQIGLTAPIGRRTRFADQVNGGTSLSSPLLAGFEADLIQGRGGTRLGFANPLLYAHANSAAFHDITSDPQGRGLTEAVIYGPYHYEILSGREMPPTLSTMGLCGRDRTLRCGPGYDMVTGLGSPGPAFFRSFGSRLVSGAERFGQ
jgi:subtilase family serine protease